MYIIFIPEEIQSKWVDLFTCLKNKLSLMYFKLKVYYYGHICIFLVYSTSILCMSNTFVTLTSVQYISNKCQSVKCPTPIGHRHASQSKVFVLLSSTECNL